MAATNNKSTFDLSYLAVLLLLAYCLASAPRYVRNFRSAHDEIKIERTKPLREVLKLGKAYTVDPYMRVFKAIRPSNLAAIFSLQLGVVGSEW